MVITSQSKPDRINGADSRELVVSGRDGMRERPSSPSVKKPNVLDHAIAQHALSVLRDQQTDSRQLRLFSNQLLTVLAFEATRNVPMRELDVDAVGGTQRQKTFGKSVVFVSLTRPGLGLSHGIADLIPNICVGSITLDHSNNSHRVEPRLHLANAPTLSDSRVILFDPVVASGVSVGIALHLLRNSGATDLSLLSFVISSPGLKRIQSATPDVVIWTAAIDEELDPKRGPLPGIGNLSERLYSGN